ncbi:hypothetical protein SAMN05421512_101341 [Stappia indica]|uniref:Uncharacterized protein n=1 Tax=Stappia indica TaxID=538381 RepID=A0A285R7U8_9HYPH|nr:hypothetical protein SAMN05421512_101341 [Stappia indica]
MEAPHDRRAGRGSRSALAGPTASTRPPSALRPPWFSGRPCIAAPPERVARPLLAPLRPSGTTSPFASGQGAAATRNRRAMALAALAEKMQGPYLPLGRHPRQAKRDPVSIGTLSSGDNTPTRAPLNTCRPGTASPVVIPGKAQPRPGTGEPWRLPPLSKRLRYRPRPADPASPLRCVRDDEGGVERENDDGRVHAGSRQLTHRPITPALGTNGSRISGFACVRGDVREGGTATRYRGPRRA